MGRKREREPQELREAVRDRGFTPSLRERDALLELLGEADAAAAEGAERALGRLGEPIVPVLIERAETARPPLRGRLCRLIGRVGGGTGPGCGFLLRALEDDDLKTRRNAAVALGKTREPRAEAALLRAWDAEPRPELRRAVAEALGKVGAARALALLRDLRTDDPELARLAARATIMLDRTATRETPSVVAGDRAFGTPVPIAFWCRAGLEELVVEELGPAWEARVAGTGRVEARLAGPPASAWVARTALGFAFPLSPERIGDGETTADAVVRVLAGDAAYGLLAQWTAGPLRYRIDFAGGGHRRALVWECARRVAERRPALRNDPTRSPWEARVAERNGVVWIELVPRGLADPRFGWRVADVPAASHPTLAAALARLGGARPDDVVWDPFVGSGGELIERARLGPCTALLGTDTDPRALAAARRNAAAAGVRLELAEADATTHRPARRPTLIVTNPPMGRRVVHHREIGGLLERFLDHAADVLAPGGRMVWIAPQPERSARQAAERGLRLELERDVDMGGFSARIQLLRKGRGATEGRAARTAARPR